MSARVSFLKYSCHRCQMTYTKLNSLKRQLLAFFEFDLPKAFPSASLHALEGCELCAAVQCSQSVFTIDGFFGPSKVNGFQSSRLLYGTADSRFHTCSKTCSGVLCSRYEGSALDGWRG